MARRRSKEESTQGLRGRSLNQDARRQSRDTPASQGGRTGSDAPDDEDAHWQRRELEPGWRQPHYEGFYDESAARDREAGSGVVSAKAHASTRNDSYDIDGSSDELWRTLGPETGKGPKGYRRSDARILEEVNERLTRHGQLDASEIEVSCRGGEVWLRGTVSDGRAKRLAEDCAKSVSGVHKVRDELKLRGGRS